MIKKYTSNNSSLKEDKKLSVFKKKTHKNSTPVSTSMCVPGQSIDQLNNLSQTSNRSYLDKSNMSQTPRSGVGTKLRPSLGKKSDISSR